MFIHPSYGTVTANIAYLADTLFVYSIAVLFNSDSSSSTCAVLFFDGMGNLIAATDLINRLAQLHDTLIQTNFVLLKVS